MADGSRKPIEEVEVGDEVLATDPETGENVAREVTHLWVHQDTLVDLIVDGDVITTTEDHPFWNKTGTDGEWQRADQLDQGDLVRSADGDLIEVNGLDRSNARTATAYNLTVDDIHTYYVGAGDETALVHNTCGTFNVRAGELGEDQTPGLGRILYERTGIPVIGVAKSRYPGTPQECEVRRGSSNRPLFVSVAGFDGDEAKRCVERMAGAGRVPTMIRRADWLTRSSRPTQ